MKIEKTETFIEHDISVNGTKIGTVELCPERYEITRLIIFEPYQNKGYGTQVVQELIQSGYKSLWVRSDNPRAIHVYEKCGFKRGNTHMFEMVANKVETGGEEWRIKNQTQDGYVVLCVTKRSVTEKPMIVI